MFRNVPFCFDCNILNVEWNIRILSDLVIKINLSVIFMYRLIIYVSMFIDFKY